MELDKRLEHFEQHQLDEGDEYGAEVLHHARERITQLEVENERLRGALIILRPKMLEAQEVMREHGFVIDNLKDPWQKFAFTLYSMLVQVHCVSDTALGGE